MRRSLIDGSEISLGSIADGVEVDNTLVISVVRIRKRAVWASAEGGALCWFCSSTLIPGKEQGGSASFSCDW